MVWSIRAMIVVFLSLGMFSSYLHLNDSIVIEFYENGESESETSKELSSEDEFLVHDYNHGQTSFDVLNGQLLSFIRPNSPYVTIVSPPPEYI